VQYHENDNNSSSTPRPRRPLLVEWVDLRWQPQQARPASSSKAAGHSTQSISSLDRNNNNNNGCNSRRCLLPTTAASCTLFLRSLLHVQHSASPWGQHQQQQQQQHIGDGTDEDDRCDRKDVVILVIDRDDDSTESSDSSSSCQPLLDYRVSDACPSWFLHAVVYAKKTAPLLLYNPPSQQQQGQKDSNNHKTLPCCSFIVDCHHEIDCRFDIPLQMKWP
jgi:hypothetical protein